MLDIDATDRAILAALQNDARARHAELGRAVGLTAPAVAARIRRLEHGGIITGYHAQIDLKKAGYGLVAFVKISSAVELSGQLNSLVVGMPEILEFHHVTGAEGFVLKVAVRSVEHLEHVIGKLLPFGQTITSIVLSSPVTWRPIEFAAEGEVGRKR
jgi:Lrp/AsnC family leucine-responsive transcriptional regulator